MIELLLPYLVAILLLTVTPGIDTVMVLRFAVSGGVLPGAASAAGIATGCLVWGGCVAVGLASLLSASALAFSILKFAGAGYLLYLAFKLVFSRPGPIETPAVEPGGGNSITAFRVSVLSNLLNPKVGVFYLTFLPQFIPEGASIAATSFLLAAIHAGLGLVWSIFLIGLARPMGRFLAAPRVRNGFNKATGGMFAFFGVHLLLSDRT